MVKQCIGQATRELAARVDSERIGNHPECVGVCNVVTRPAKFTVKVTPLSDMPIDQDRGWIALSVAGQGVINRLTFSNTREKHKAIMEVCKIASRFEEEESQKEKPLSTMSEAEMIDEIEITMKKVLVEIKREIELLVDETPKQANTKRRRTSYFLSAKSNFEFAIDNLRKSLTIEGNDE